MKVHWKDEQVEVVEETDNLYALEVSHWDGSPTFPEYQIIWVKKEWVQPFTDNNMWPEESNE